MNLDEAGGPEAGGDRYPWEDGGTTALAGGTAG
jgi:hypothetical protein